MEKKNGRTEINLAENVFDVKDKQMPKGSWWWWFWLYFFENPDNPSQPRQLMILWSAKDVDRIKCNDLQMEFDEIKNGSNFKGAVAAWYFDGEKMHHDYVLEQCDFDVSNKKLVSNSTVPTSYEVQGKDHRVEIGNKFTFKAREDDSMYGKPSYKSDSFIGEKGYSIMRANKLNLKAVVENQKCDGTAYFQRVFVNAPAVPWYWGIFHFDNGGMLSYYNPSFMGVSIKEEIEFFDGEEYYRFDEMNVERTGGEIPKFHIWAENENQSIEFDVNSYSHSSWTFRRRALKFIPNKLTYNEYPSTVSNLVFRDKENSEEITSEDLGKAVGNAEHTKGLLF